MSIRHKKIDIENWGHPFLNNKALGKKIGKRKGTIMFPTTHDLHKEFLSEIIEHLWKLIYPGNRILIVSKPEIEVIDEICYTFRHYKDKILFRFSIGSSNDEVLSFWEPNAPNYSERIRCLKLAAGLGFETSISCEPMLDDHIDMVVEDCRNWVTDSIWLGKMNFPTQRIKINNPGFKDWDRLEFVLDCQTDSNIKALYERFKDDPLIKWKESIKKVVGIDLLTKPGEDK